VSLRGPLAFLRPHHVVGARIETAAIDRLPAGLGAVGVVGIGEREVAAVLDRPRAGGRLHVTVERFEDQVLLGEVGRALGEAEREYLLQPEGEVRLLRIVIRVFDHHGGELALLLERLQIKLADDRAVANEAQSATRAVGRRRQQQANRHGRQQASHALAITSPPSTMTIWPLTRSLSELARKRNAPSVSRISSMRRSAVRSTKNCRCSSLS